MSDATTRLTGDTVVESINIDPYVRRAFAYQDTHGDVVIGGCLDATDRDALRRALEIVAFGATMMEAADDATPVAKQHSSKLLTLFAAFVAAMYDDAETD